MKYIVYTPPYETSVGDYGSDVVIVEAPNKSKAKGMALVKLRRTSSLIRDALLDKKNPFALLTVEPENGEEAP